MEITDKENIEFPFQTKGKADAFCKSLRELSGNVGYITLNDILREMKEPVVRGGGDIGYDKKVIRKLKSERSGNEWTVRFPEARKIVQDINGYWTAEPIERSD